MLANPVRIRPSRAAFVALLIVALIFAHWQGLAHRIGHASQPYAGVDNVAPSQAPTHKNMSHSCLAFDAATVGAAICSQPFIVVIPSHAHVLALWIAFTSRHPPFTPHFSSRAPPLS